MKVKTPLKINYLRSNLKSLFIVFLMLFMILELFSQSGDYVAGQIVTTQDDTLNVYIKNIDYSYDGNSKIRYYQESYDNRSKIARKHITTLIIKEKIYRNISYYIYNFDSEEDVNGSDSDGSEKVIQLMELKAEGLISLYSTIYTYASADGSNRGTVVNYYIAKEGEIYEQVASTGFRNYIKRYIDDCDFLYEKVLDKTYTYRNIVEIITKYNTECQNN